MDVMDGGMRSENADEDEAGMDIKHRRVGIRGVQTVMMMWTMWGGIAWQEAEAEKRNLFMRNGVV